MSVVGGIILLALLMSTQGYGATHLSDLPKPILDNVQSERRDIRCFLSDEKIASMKELDVLLVKRKGLKYIAVFYSIDGGDKVNVTFLYPFENGKVHPFPTVYVFGDPINRKNGSPLQVYADQTGDGTCKSIVWEPTGETP